MMIWEKEYEKTLMAEVLREKSAGILADFNRYIKKEQIKNETDNSILLLKENVGEIYRNIFKPEYDDIEKLNEANAKLDAIVKTLKDLE